MERWRMIESTNDKYMISDYGNVKSLYHDIILRPKTDKNGYLEVVLTVGKKQYTRKVHRLVAQAFIANPDDLPQVNHKDENKKNNTVNNLEWCSLEYNLAYGTGRIRNGIRHRKPVKCVDTNETFPSIRIASHETGIDGNSISRCAKGKVNTAGNMKWEFVCDGD